MMDLISLFDIAITCIMSSAIFSTHLIPQLTHVTIPKGLRSQDRLQHK